MALSACGENTTPPSETTKETVLAPSEQNPKPATQTADDDHKKMLDSLIDDVPYTLNSDGVVTFANVSDMMTAFNDYQYDEQFKVSGDNPIHLEIYDLNTETNTKENLEYDQQKALIYGIYKTFTHTDFDKLTISAGVKDMQDASKIIVKPITLTVTKEQA